MKKKNRLALFLLSLTTVLILIGLIMIYNASCVEAEQVFGNKFYYVSNQALWFMIGLLALFIVSFISYKKIKLVAFILLILNISQQDLGTRIIFVFLAFVTYFVAGEILKT